MGLDEPIVVGDPPHTYRVHKKLNAMDQFHVTRRLGPAIVVAGVTLRMILEGKNVSMDAMVSVAGPVMQVVSHMSDEDVEYIIRKCMSTVERMQSSAFAPVMTPDGKDFMFNDMDQAEMIRLTCEVIGINLENFMKGMREDGTSSDASAATAHPSTSSPSA